MTPQPPRRRAPPIWILVSLAWVVPALLAALQRYMQGALGNWDPAGWRQLAWEAADWLVYGLLTPVVFWCAARWRLTRHTLTTRLPLHLAFSVLLCGAWAAMGELLRWFVIPGQQPPSGQTMIGWFFISLPFGVSVYFAVLGIEYATHYFVEARERETQAARLRAQLADARLSALRMQIQPHFLLNTLNAITVIVRDRDHETATRMLEQLGDMLRRVVRSDRPPEIPLRDELEFLRQYLGIEQVRFSDRLRAVIAVPDQLQSALVPEFILQPLVENALRHGVAERSEATSVIVDGMRDGDDLVLRVTDNGPGIGVQRPGIGLSNTSERLATLYGDRGRLTLSAPPGGGTRAEVRLPFHEQLLTGGDGG
jgi:two-component system, LytTR family, sensor kinase